MIFRVRSLSCCWLHSRWRVFVRQSTDWNPWFVDLKRPNKLREVGRPLSRLMVSNSKFSRVQYRLVNSSIWLKLIQGHSGSEWSVSLASDRELFENRFIDLVGLHCLLGPCKLLNSFFDNSQIWLCVAKTFETLWFTTAATCLQWTYWDTVHLKIIDYESYSDR